MSGSLFTEWVLNSIKNASLIQSCQTIPRVVIISNLIREVTLPVLLPVQVALYLKIMIIGMIDELFNSNHMANMPRSNTPVNRDLKVMVILNKEVLQNTDTLQDLHRRSSLMVDIEGLDHRILDGELLHQVS